MIITIADWMCGPNLKGTKYDSQDPKVNGSFIEGNVDDAFKIMRELYDHGLNCMIKRIKPKNIGTKKNPNWTEESIIIFVDDQGFHQR